ncbi:MAG TPA: VWA domain-containing protein [Polyangiaceae bacterium]|nr:VWA domain-containing protein [Polyangiaceae bacterium]
MKFAEPLWLLGTLLALLLGGLLVLGAFRGVRALRRFGEPGPVDALLTAKVGSRRATKGALSVLGLAACFVALAQPQYGWGTRRIPATNLDVIVALDYSKSMYARDVAPNRIERAKSEVARLIMELAGARFGAVAFAGEALSFPLTSDGGAIAQFFRQLTPHDMPVGGTAIARALDAGRSLLERDPRASKHKKVMLLVTDGEDLEGDPEQAARQAKEAGISIYVVQIGGRTPEAIPDMDEQGVDRGLRRNDRGQVMTTALTADGERQLAQIAEITGASVVQSAGGSTGIEEIARRLRAMMTDELSERVETVYADVYAYPLGVALLLLAVEAFLPEVRPRRRRALEKRSKAATLHAALEASAEGQGGAGAPRTRVRRALGQAGLSSLVPLAALGVWHSASGCNSPAVDAIFTRDAPAVDKAIAALESRDAGAAEQHLADYLGLSPCREGTINATAALANRAQASFDLGLALFQIGERFGGRFGDDPGRAQEDARLLARRSAEVACALSVVRQLVERPSLPLELRAQAYYLLGNLEFLRREYEAAVASYDRSLTLIPADDAESSPAVGRDAAHNRALALRLRDENEPPPPPDAGPPPNPGDGGSPPDEPPQHGDAGQRQDQQDQDQQQKDQQDQQQKDQQQKDQQDQKSQDQQQKEQKGQKPQDPHDSRADTPEPEPQKASPPPQPMSLSQDDKMLDQLERAPTVQQEAARAQRGRVRRVVEDK